MIRGIQFMANDKSLISLALIKTNWEERQKDFIDMFIPFVLYSMSDLKSGDIVSIIDIRKQLNCDFGIDIYNNVLETFFKRLSDKHHYNPSLIFKNKGIYYRTNEKIDMSSFESRRDKYSEDQEKVINSFIEFLNDKKVVSDFNLAKEKLISYLCKYGYSILQDKVQTHETNIWTKRIGEFIDYSYKNNSQIFEYIKDIAKGGMLTTVYFSSELKVVPTKKFRNTTIYFDTPLLMYILNYSGNALQKTVQELLDLLRGNGAKVCAFEHNMLELQSILEAYVSRYRKGTLNTSYNFDYLVENDVKPEKIETDIPLLKTMLRSKGITIVETPPYDDYWKNIGETNFNHYLSEKILYKKSDRRDNDVRSIAAIYRLRGRTNYQRYETCEALFVATNSYLVYHTQKYFKDVENKKGIPAIVDDTFLTSLLWLKDTSRSDTLPTLKIVADALAAQEPSKSFWDNFNNKIDELQEMGEITENEVIELKYGLFSKKNMFDVTEGDIDKITHETVREVQRMNFRMQHKEVVEEKENAIEAKNIAIHEKNMYLQKYYSSHFELIEMKSQKYLKQIKRRRKCFNLLGLLVVCVIIYFAVSMLTGVFGMISNMKIVLDLGAPAVIFFVGGILNLFTDKFISNESDRISNCFVRKYIEKTFQTIRQSEGEDAKDVADYVKHNL